jgi:hypothetical protein
MLVDTLAVASLTLSLLAVTYSNLIGRRMSQAQGDQAPRSGSLV